MRITKLEAKKKSVKITFDNGQSLDLVVEVLGEFYLYKNKELSDEELYKLKQYSEMLTHYHYALRVLARGLYSREEITNKLVKRQVEELVISLIVDRLSKNNLLNDETYAKSVFSYYFKQNYGPKFIKKRLEDKGIDLSIIDKIVVIDESTQLANANLLANKLVEKTNKIAKSKLLNKIYSKLNRYGYDHHICAQVVTSLKSSLYVDETMIIIKDYQRLATRLSRSIDDQKILKQKISVRLAQKGYSYSQIKKVVEEQENVY